MRQRIVAALSTLFLTLGGLAVLGVVGAPAANAAVQVIPVPTSDAGLGRIVTAPNGTIWFIEEDANKVGRIVNGQIIETQLEADFPGTTTIKDIDVAPDSTVWVTYQQGRWVTHLDQNGVKLADFELNGYDYADDVRVAADGTAWVVVGSGNNSLALFNGATGRYVANAPDCQDSLGEAADGSMWCRTSSGLTKLSASGGGQTFPANNYAAYPYAIAAGPVGAIWFGRYFSGTFVTSPDDGEVGFLDANGIETAYNTGERTAPNDLVQGPDGNMWFTSIGAAAGIGHIAPNGKSGALTAIGKYEPNSLTFGTDGLIYATDSENNVIIRVSRADLQVTNVDPGEGSVLYGANPGKVKAGKKPIVVKNDRVGVQLACPKTAAKGCQGTARLLTNAKKKPKAVSGKAKYKVKKGKKGAISLKLSKKGLKAVKKGKVTTLRVALYAKGSKEPVAIKVIKVRR